MSIDTNRSVFGGLKKKLNEVRSLIIKKPSYDVLNKIFDAQAEKLDDDFLKYVSGGEDSTLSKTGTYFPKSGSEKNAFETVGTISLGLGLVASAAGLVSATIGIVSHLSEGPGVWLEGVRSPKHLKITDSFIKAGGTLFGVSLPLMITGALLTLVRRN